ncbi:MAG: ABC transporter ATP-binding protein [Christensenellales bacterium]
MGADSTQNVICKAIGLKKTYFGSVETPVIRGIDVEFYEGDFTALLGESGSGKSTLLYLLSGIETPTEGSVTLLNKELGKISDNEMAALRRHGFSFVYQFDNLIGNITAEENVLLPLRLDRQDVKTHKEKFQELIEYLQIKDCIKRYPKQLSGGEQQRVALCRALITNPKLIFLDEPTGSLDAQMGTQVMELLKDINKTRKVALIMVTHSAAHAEYASRQIRIKDGQIESETSLSK